MNNRCKSCGKELCTHGRLHVHEGIVECTDCGVTNDRYPPNWKPKMHILDPKEVEKLWWSGEGMIKNPIIKDN